MNIDGCMIAGLANPKCCANAECTEITKTDPHCYMTMEFKDKKVTFDYAVGQDQKAKLKDAVE